MKSLEKMTLKELQDKARKWRITGFSKLNKSELLVVVKKEARRRELARKRAEANAVCLQGKAPISEEKVVGEEVATEVVPPVDEIQVQPEQAESTEETVAVEETPAPVDEEARKAAAALKGEEPKKDTEVEVPEPSQVYARLDRIEKYGDNLGEQVRILQLRVERIDGELKALTQKLEGLSGSLQDHKNETPSLVVFEEGLKRLGEKVEEFRRDVARFESVTPTREQVREMIKGETTAWAVGLPQKVEETLGRLGVGKPRPSESNSKSREEEPVRVEELEIARGEGKSKGQPAGRETEGVLSKVLREAREGFREGFSGKSQGGVR